MRSKRQKLGGIGAFALAALATFPRAGSAQGVPPTFFVKNYLGNCLSIDGPLKPGAPVVLTKCNESTDQRIGVVEVDKHHRVVLYMGSLVIGAKAPAHTIRAADPTAEAATSPEPVIELQHRAETFSSVPVEQVWILDGDSIILASDRTKVIQVPNSHAAEGTQLVLGPRELKDAEFWKFTIGPYYSNVDPTTGFVHVSQDPTGSANAFAIALAAASDGTVLVLDSDVDLSLDPYTPLEIPAGVTIRGDRSGVNLGPRLSIIPSVTSDGTLFEAAGGNTRITGLRLQGPSRSTGFQAEWTGILAHDFSSCIIDHNDLSDWTDAAVNATNDDNPITETSPPDRAQSLVVVRNFIHHNEKEGLGYGVVASGGAFPLVEGNTFIMNRHAIAADGHEHTGYRARYNLVQSAAPVYVKHLGLKHEYEQDFDMHGTGSKSYDPLSPCFGVEHCGGPAGEYVEIESNTFLGTNRLAFFLRGTPSYLAEFSSNIVARPEQDAIENAGASSKLHLSNNDFGASNPTKQLGVGDFDGDGVQDVFLATGAAWYYSPAGKAEWRFLNARSDKFGDVLLGDLDGDGITDVIAKYGDELMVSWGGRSAWEPLFSTSAQISDLAIGDFNGDQRADIFYANGRNWYISYGGASLFSLVQTSSFRVKDLRFGKLDGARTDVFGIEGGSWHASYGGVSSWTALPVSLTSSVNGLVLADFDGDGRADIAHGSGELVGWEWKFSSAGTRDWTIRKPEGSALWETSIAGAAAIGNFDAAPGADILLWGSTLGSNHFSIVSGGSLSGTASAVAESRQDMR